MPIIITNWFSSLSFFLLLFLASSIAVSVAGECCIEGISSLLVARDEVGELLDLLVLFFGCVLADGQGANELREGEGSLVLVLYSVFGEHFLAGLFDATGGETVRYVSQGTQWEVWLDLGTVLFHEVTPHHPSCRVIREWEVNLLIKELLKLFLRSFLRMTRATNNGDPCLVIDELGPPLRQCLLYSLWIRRVRLLLLSTLLAFLALLLGWPHLLALVDVDDGWLVLLGCDHHGGDELLFFFLALVDAVDVYWTEIEEDGVGLGDAGADDEGLACALGTVEEERPDVLWEPGSAEL